MGIVSAAIFGLFMSAIAVVAYSCISSAIIWAGNRKEYAELLRHFRRRIGQPSKDQEDTPQPRPDP